MTYRAPLALILAPLVACGSGGTSLGVGFDVEGATARSAHLTVSTLDVWVAEVVFDADLPNRSISVSKTQNARVDALTGTADPDLVEITLDPGSYGSPYFGVELWDDGPEPALTLEGELDGVPIRFVFNSGEVFEAEAERVVVEEGTQQDVVFTLKPERWFAGVNAATLTVGADGVAEISEQANAGVFSQVADRLDITTDGRFPNGVGTTTTTTTWDTGTYTTTTY